jgi:hypothetical protein
LDKQAADADHFSCPVSEVTTPGFPIPADGGKETKKQSIAALCEYKQPVDPYKCARGAAASINELDSLIFTPRRMEQGHGASPKTSDLFADRFSLARFFVRSSHTPHGCTIINNRAKEGTKIQ